MSGLRMSEKHVTASDQKSGPDPFGAAASDLHRRGLVVVPCNGDDGKTPAVSNWDRRKSTKTIDSWAARMSSLNIGVAIGASGLVVVDVDTPGDEALRRALEIFGDTPNASADAPISQ